MSANQLRQRIAVEKPREDRAAGSISMSVRRRRPGVDGRVEVPGRESAPVPVRALGSASEWGWARDPERVVTDSESEGLEQVWAEAPVLAWVAAPVLARAA